MNNGRGDIITVDIERDLHNVLSSKAKAKNTSLRKFVNNMLYMEIEKNDFLKKVAPRLSMIEMTEKDILLRDETATKTRFVQIIIRNEMLWCDLDEINDCRHIHFVMMLPEFAKFKDIIKSI